MNNGKMIFVHGLNKYVVSLDTSIKFVCLATDGRLVGFDDEENAIFIKEGDLLVVSDARDIEDLQLSNEDEVINQYNEVAPRLEVFEGFCLN